MNQAAGMVGLRPLGVGEVLDVAIKLYRRNFAVLLKAVAVVIVPVQLLAGIVQQSAQITSEDLTTTTNVYGQEQLNIDGGDVWMFIAAILVSTVLTFVAGQLASAASLRIIGGAYLDERPGWRESLRFAFSRLGALLWLAFIYTLLLVLGFVACIIPGIYLYAAWSVAVPVLLLEDKRGGKALGRSRELVQGRWWPVAGVLLLTTILTGVIGAALAGLFTLPVVGLDSDIATVIFGTVGSTIASVLTTPFTAAVIIVMYVDLRVRREGFDLELLARRIGVAPPTGPPPEMFRGWSPPPGPYGWQPPPPAGWPRQPPAGWQPPPPAGWQPPPVPEPRWEGPPEDWQPPPDWTPEETPPPPPPPPPPPAPPPRRTEPLRVERPPAPDDRNDDA